MTSTDSETQGSLSTLAGCQPRALLAPAEIRLGGFDSYLKNALTSHKDISYLLSITSDYQNMLSTGNASELHSLTKDMKRQALRALSHLAKFNGC